MTVTTPFNLRVRTAAAEREDRLRILRAIEAVGDDTPGDWWLPADWTPAETARLFHALNRVALRGEPIRGFAAMGPPGFAEVALTPKSRPEDDVP